jgi:ClpP class serine protease
MQTFGGRRVAAVVLRINSPGGGVTASDIMTRDLREFRARHAELRSKVLGDPPSGSTMAASYLQLIERLLANA